MCMDWQIENGMALFINPDPAENLTGNHFLNFRLYKHESI